MKNICPIVVACLLVSACGYQEGVVLRADRSYVKFIGNWRNATVQIDSMQPFDLRPAGPSDDPKTSPDNTRYQVAPGRHRIMVSQGGRVVVDLVVILENHATMEVHIP